MPDRWASSFFLYPVFKPIHHGTCPKLLDKRFWNIRKIQRICGWLGRRNCLLLVGCGSVLEAQQAPSERHKLLNGFDFIYLQQGELEYSIHWLFMSGFTVTSFARTLPFRLYDDSALPITYSISLIDKPGIEKIVQRKMSTNLKTACGECQMIIKDVIREFGKIP